MRGKLRDKRAATKRDIITREVMERRRPSKRDTRTVVWLDQLVEDDDVLELDEDEATRVQLPQKK